MRRILLACALCPALTAQCLGAKKPPPSAATAIDALLAFGASLEESSGGLLILHVHRASTADQLGLKARDILMTLNGRRTQTPLAAAKALRSWKPETRTSAVVVRADARGEAGAGYGDLRGDLILLESPARHWPRPVNRDPLRLGPYEHARALAHTEAARGEKRSPLAALKAPSFRVPAGERIWIRFPKGIAQTVQAGDIIEGETSTALAADKTLDFLVIGQGSRVWAQVVGSAFKDGARIVRLVVYKIETAGGKTYPCTAIVRAVSGTARSVEIAGGAIVAAPDDENPFLLPTDANFQIEFREDLRILEPVDYYRVGPGLWLRTSQDSSDRFFEISHVIDGRSAEAADLKEGDRVTHINGRPVYRLGFSAAIDGLYGTPGSAVELKVLRASTRRATRIRLVRGAGYKTGFGLTPSSGREAASYPYRYDISGRLSDFR